MLRALTPWIVALLSLSSLSSCDSDSTPADPGPTDAQAADASARDVASPHDVATVEDLEAAPDAALADLAPVDVEAHADVLAPDLSAADAAPLDAGREDVGGGSDGGGLDLGGADDLGGGDTAPDGAPSDLSPPDLSTPDLGPGDAGPADSGVADAGAPWPGYPWEPTPGICGGSPYAWLPPDAVGEVLQWEESPGFRLSREMISALLAGAGYPDVVVPLYGTRVWTLRYTTQDHGELREATGLVAVPDLAAEPGVMMELPTILAMHPTVGYDDRCAPSAGLEGPAAALIPASQGYIGVAPDLLGLCGVGEPCPDAFHPYLIGEPTAVAAWDAVRAGHLALAALAPETGVLPTAEVVPWGPSQGGHGALFADLYGEHYAPEFEIPCAAAVVPPADLAGAAANALDHLSGATQLGTAFLAAAYLWYAPEAPASELFNAAGPRDFAEHIPATFPDCCRARDLLAGAERIEDVYTAEVLAAVAEGRWEDLQPWGCMVLENSLPTSSVPRSVDHPVLIVLGERDEMVWPPAQREAVRSLCEQGHRIEMVECAGQNHTNAALGSVQLQLEWMRACVAGEVIPDERLCRIDPPVECR